MRKKHFLRRIIFAVFALVLCGYTLFEFGRFYQKKISFRVLNRAIQKQIAAYPGIDCSFFIRDLSTRGLKLTLRADEQFPAASLIKLPVLAAAFKAVAEGKISLDEPITIQPKDIWGGSGKLKARKMPNTLTFEALLELMISASDNTATNKVIAILGFDYIDTAFKELGLGQTRLTRRMMDFSRRGKGVENYTSSRDIAGLLERIYDNKLINRQFSGLALEFLQKQRIKDRLPRYLPEEIVVAHKTGLERGVVHDAGIIFGPKGNYLICILTRRAKSSSQAKKLIAQVSLLTYNLYQ